MKLNKLLVAVVLSAAAVSANAAIEVGSGGSQSEIVFSAWDGNNGYTFDLNWNQTLDALAGAESIGGFTGSYNASNKLEVEGNTIVAASLIGNNGIIYDSALTGFNLSGANVKWNLNAIDYQGRPRLLTTANSSVTNVVIKGRNLFGAVNVLSGYYPASTSFNQTTADDTYALTDNTNGAAYAGQFGNGLVGNTFNTTNALGGQSFLYELAGGAANLQNEDVWHSQVKTASGQNVIARTYQQNGEWRLQIAVAAVPEPQTYAMLLAGLGVMGASARRRIK